MSKAKARKTKTSQKPTNDRILRVALSVALVLITLAAFWGVFGNDFAGYDDEAYVVRNDHIKHGLGLATVKWAFSTMYCANWHPLTWISHTLDCCMFEMDPAGHHLTSLLLHIASTLLLFLLLRRMTGAIWRSAFVAALFAVHPLHVESVAFAAERKDVLSALFWMLTMLAYLRYVQRTCVKRYLLVILIFALGLMAKPMLVSLPIALLLLDWWPLGRIKGTGNREQGEEGKQRDGEAPADPRPLARLILEKLPLLVMIVVSSVVTFIAQSQSAVVSTAKYPIIGRIENAFVSYAGYLYKMVWPAGLSFFYPYRKHLPVWQVSMSAILIAAITVLVFTRWRTRRYMAAGWLWYLITLVPVIGLVQVGEQAMADRYTYIPLIGIFIMIAWGIGDVVERLRAGVTYAAAGACIVVVALSAVTANQVTYWRNDEALLRHAIKVDSDNGMAHYNLGVILHEHGRYDESLPEFREAVRCDPEDSASQMNLGLVLVDKGEFREALGHLRAAARLDPKNANAQFSYGNGLIRCNRYRESIAVLRKAVKLQPDLAGAHQSLAAVYYLTGDYRAAWSEVRLVRKYGDESPDPFIEALSAKMPEPYR
jgi:hypothetical protein